MENLGYQYLICGLISLGLSIIIGIKYRKRIGYFCRIIGVGIIVAISIMFYPFSENDIVYSIITAFQAGTLGAGYDSLMPDIIKISECELFSYDFIYKAILQFLMFVSPLFIGGILITLSDKLRYKIVYFIKKYFYEIYYFSQLNDTSIILAESILKKDDKKGKLIVFCDFNKENTDKKLTKLAKKSGFILLENDMSNIIRYGKHNKKIFQISDNRDINLNQGKELIDTINKKGFDVSKFELYIFTNQIEAEIIINSTDKKGLKVIIIDEPVRLAYDLMFDIPLYTSIKDKTTKIISVLVVGASRLGIEVVKAASWCGQLGDEYKLEIIVVDRNIVKIEKEFNFSYPSFKEYGCDIKFYEAEMLTTDFENILKNNCKKVNYIVVTLENNNEAVKTAIFLREHYLRDDLACVNEPIITVFIPNTINFSYILNLSIKKNKYSIQPFGDNKEFYSYENIVNSEIEKLAINSQAVYSKPTVDETFEEYKKRIIEIYNENEIDKRSNRANITHIKYKLYSLGYEMKFTNNDEETQDLGVLLSLKEDLVSKAELLAKMEHLRWNAFQIAEGYRSVSTGEVRSYIERTKSHKNIMAKLHPCICSWEMLDEVSSKCNEFVQELSEKDECFKNINKYDFKKQDFEFTTKLLKVIGAENDKLTNIGECKYIITKKEI